MIVSCQVYYHCSNLHIISFYFQVTRDLPRKGIENFLKEVHAQNNNMPSDMDSLRNMAM